MHARSPRKIRLKEKWKKQTWKDDEEKQRLLDYPWTWVDESKDDDDIFMPRSKGKSIASSNDKSAAFSKGKSVAPPSIDSDDDFMPSSKGESARASSKGKSAAPSKGKKYLHTSNTMYKDIISCKMHR
jgi:hypothetical protein